MGCCSVVKMPGGGVAIVCTRSRRHTKCACGHAASRLCDWKVKGKRSGTCDVPLCKRCTHSPAAEKDLCPEHAAEWKTRSEAQQKENAAKPQGSLL